MELTLRMKPMRTSPHGGGSMEAGKDPRPDQHPNREGGKFPDPPANSNPKPGPGGLGTDTHNDPANEPAAQPGKQR